MRRQSQLLVPREFILGPCQQVIFNKNVPGVAHAFSAYRASRGEAPWMMKMFNVRDEPRPLLQHHLKCLPEKFRTQSSTISRALGTPDLAESFRQFKEEAEFAKLAALSENPYHG